jgi:dephospho-CoA kinase
MKTWIITGGVGCGKSSVADLLLRHGRGRAKSFSSDQAVQTLLDSPETLGELERVFGPAAVIRPENALPKADRSWLRQHVFADDAARRSLEMLLHPGVLAALEAGRAQALSEEGSNLFLAEVPLHYEIGATVSADLVIVVAASQTVQVRRLMERRGLDRSIIEQMLRAQWPIEAKVERADVVIWNDGDTEALELQVLTLARQLWLE